MYELIQLTERTYYIKSPTNIGLFRLDEKNGRVTPSASP